MNKKLEIQLCNLGHLHSETYCEAFDHHVKLILELLVLLTQLLLRSYTMGQSWLS